MHLYKCRITITNFISERQTSFNLDKGPSDKWFRNLVKDHPQLTERTAQNQDRARARMSNEKIVAEFFKFWKDILNENSMNDKPDQVQLKYAS